MRCFVVICVLATAAYADVSHLGYNYGQGVGHIGQGLGGGVLSGSGLLNGPIGGGSVGCAGGAGGFGCGSVGLGGGFGGLSGGHGSYGGGNVGSLVSSEQINSIGGSLLSSGVFTTGPSPSRQHHQQQVVEEPAQVEFVKEFYSFDAPSEEYHEDENLQRMKESLKKNLQVVFIKTPESRAVQHAAVSLAKSASESNTAIYVLQKQPDISQFSNQLNLIHTHKAHKPEVHFVKYNTPEEAAKAQHTIQSQYESLGGTSVHKQGGVPQVLNYGSDYAPAYGGHQVISGGPSSGGAVLSGPSQIYLPSAHKK